MSTNRIHLDEFVVEVSKTEHGDLRVTVLRPTRPGLLVAHEVRCVEPRMVIHEYHSC